MTFDLNWQRYDSGAGNSILPGTGGQDDGDFTGAGCGCSTSLGGMAYASVAYAADVGQRRCRHHDQQFTLAYIFYRA